MKPWWVAFLFACASEPKPAPVAPAPQSRAPTPAEPPADPATVEPDPAYANILVGEGPPGDGDMTQRRPGADLGSQISDVREGGKSDDTPRVGKAHTPTDGSPRPVDPGKPGRISVLEKQAFDNTTLSADFVLAKIQSAYMAAVRRCYRAYLKKDPSAKGDLVLKISVSETGRTSTGTAKGVADEIGDCVTGAMASWRFPVPKNANGEATMAAFQIKLGLAPE